MTSFMLEQLTEELGVRGRKGSQTRELMLKRRLESQIKEMKRDLSRVGGAFTRAIVKTLS